MFRAPMHPPMLRPLFALAVATVSVTASIAWGAEPDVTRAKEAYERAVRAHAAGDHQTAARAFAEADALVPATASIEAALESAMKADDEVLGTELLERAAQRQVDPALAKTLDAARKRFAGRTGKIRVDCALATKCLASVDGVASDAWRAIIVKVGAHTVVVRRDDEKFDRLVEVQPDAVVMVGPEAPREQHRPYGPERTTPTTTSKGISPAWFFVGLGVTAALGAFTTWSGIDAVKQHDEFESNGCALNGRGPVPADCNARAEDGDAAKTRTNLGIALTGVAAAITVVTGAFFVRWSSAPSGNGGVAMIGGSFR
jgi:hypothetical protein